MALKQLDASDSLERQKAESDQCDFSRRHCSLQNSEEETLSHRKGMPAKGKEKSGVCIGGLRNEKLNTMAGTAYV